MLDDSEVIAIVTENKDAEEAEEGMLVEDITTTNNTIIEGSTMGCNSTTSTNERTSATSSS